MLLNLTCKPHRQAKTLASRGYPGWISAQVHTIRGASPSPRGASPTLLLAPGSNHVGLFKPHVAAFQSRFAATTPLTLLREAGLLTPGSGFCLRHHFLERLCPLDQWQNSKSSPTLCGPVPGVFALLSPPQVRHCSGLSAEKKENQVLDLFFGGGRRGQPILVASPDSVYMGTVHMY